MPSLQGAQSGVPLRSASNVDDDAPPWTIAVPAEPGDNRIFSQDPGDLELASGLPHHPDSLQNPAAFLAADMSSAPEAASTHGQATEPSASRIEDDRGQVNAVSASHAPQECHSTQEFRSTHDNHASQGNNAARPAFAQMRQRSMPAACWQDQSTFCWRPVQVDVFSLGSFTFKGMDRDQRIAQVLPTALASRLELFSHVLKRGKATCTKQDDSHLHAVTMWLPEIVGLMVAR